MYFYMLGTLMFAIMGLTLNPTVTHAISFDEPRAVTRAQKHGVDVPSRDSKIILDHYLKTVLGIEEDPIAHDDLINQFERVNQYEREKWTQKKNSTGKFDSVKFAGIKVIAYTLPIPQNASEATLTQLREQLENTVNENHSSVIRCNFKQSKARLKIVCLKPMYWVNTESKKSRGFSVALPRKLHLPRIRKAHDCETFSSSKKTRVLFTEHRVQLFKQNNIHSRKVEEENLPEKLSKNTGELEIEKLKLEKELAQAQEDLKSAESQLMFKQPEEHSLSFLIDGSGSIWRDYCKPFKNCWEYAIKNLATTVSGLKPDQKFNICIFSAHVVCWKSNSQYATPENIKEALLYLNRLLEKSKRPNYLPFYKWDHYEGVTEKRTIPTSEALSDALNFQLKSDPDLERAYVFTDGVYSSHELKTLKKQHGKNRSFSVTIKPMGDVDSKALNELSSNQNDELLSPEIKDTRTEVKKQRLKIEFITKKLNRIGKALSKAYRKLSN